MKTSVLQTKTVNNAVVAVLKTNNEPPMYIVASRYNASNQTWEHGICYDDIHDAIKKFITIKEV